MPAPAPTAAPPNFYDNLPQGGSAAPAGAGAKSDENDTDGEILKALSGCYRVLSKVGKLKDELKPGLDKIKSDIKALVVQGLKKDPSQLESGDDGSSAPPPAATNPKTTDETHAA